MAILFAVTRGHLDDVKTNEVKEWEADFHRYLDGSRRDVLAAIEDTGDLSEETEAKLVEAIAEFKKTVTAEA